MKERESGERDQKEETEQRRMLGEVSWEKTEQKT